ncbi:outer membrane beta-barrel protein [Vibrio mexicanus]|uniref:outer membrane beta-barrel protein n=1 Tax=Vibrio mexicanus TaxID=1004326 RepID=UPI00063C7A34|nr:outer membrane beta-barrel protein [Vibrio mexicanus]
MKNVLSLAILAAVAAPSTYATSVDYFVGGGMGYHSATVKVEDGDGDIHKETAKGAAFHIRGGAYIAEDHRLTLTANFTGDNELDALYIGDAWAKAELAQTEWLASYDYVHGLNEDFSIFGGATVGYIKNKGIIRGNVGEDFKHSESESDFAFGGQVGVQYHVAQNVSIDGTYRYMGTSYKSKEFADKVSNHSEFIVSLDYRF